MFVIMSRAIDVYSVFPVCANDVILRCLSQFTLPYQPPPTVNVHYLHIYGMPAVTSVVAVCQILEFGLCGCVLRIFHSICQLSSVSACNRWRAADDDNFEVRHSLLTTAGVSSPCAVLSCPSMLSAIWPSQATHLISPTLLLLPAYHPPSGHPTSPQRTATLRSPSPVQSCVNSPSDATHTQPESGSSLRWCGLSRGWMTRMKTEKCCVWVASVDSDERRRELRETTAREMGNWRQQFSEVMSAVHAVLRGWHADCCDYRARAQRQKSWSHIFVRNRNSITQHTSSNKISGRHRYVLKRWACQPLA